MSDEQRPILVIDGEIMLAVIWYGGSTFYIHTCNVVVGEVAIPFAETAVFTYYGNENGDPPDAMQAYAKMQDWLDEQGE